MQVKEIADRALDLLDGAPNDSGVFVRLATVSMGNLLDESPHGHDNELYFAFKDGQFSAEARRVVGLAFLNTVPPDTVTIAAEQSETLAGLRQSCDRLLSKVPDSCAQYRINFHISEFARYTAPKGSEIGLLDRIHFIARRRDSALWDFAAKTAARAIAWKPLNESARSLSLWFHPETEGLSAIYFTVRPEKKGISVHIDDRVPFPWRESTKHVWSIDKLGEAIADYLCRHHAGLAAASVYYGYGC